MDLGISRFVEMFEERFGRWPTTLLLAMLGLAVFTWGLQTVIEAAIYVYKLIVSAHFLAALEAENAAAHLIIFGVQIVLTFLALGLIWRLFYVRKLKNAEDNFRATETKLKGLLQDIENDVIDYEQKVAALENREDRLKDRMAEIKARQEEILARASQKPNPPASSESG